MTAPSELDRPPDPREQEEWFQRLPVHVQQQTRSAWQRREQSTLLLRTRDARRVGRVARDAAALLALVSVFAMAFLLRSWLQLFAIVAAATVVGAVAGVVIAVGNGGRFRAAFVGGAAYAVVFLTSIGFRLGGLLMPLLLFGGAWLAANVFGVFGLRLEQRRSVFESDPSI